MRSKAEILDKITALEAGVLLTTEISNEFMTNETEAERTFCEIGIGMLKWVLQ